MSKVKIMTIGDNQDLIDYLQKKIGKKIKDNPNRLNNIEFNHIFKNQADLDGLGVSLRNFKCFMQYGVDY